ncbi:hypothetical protein MKZ38_007778 [Zalerion maritima]|uniref:Reverse transcriptase n=1 Tax=Zalerion maritima TaxID=339359 RepID=A0AAD5RVS6_9PEZI|nr:hypothetical protein MKZ38_007778 [Zalerion maritima]
MATPRGVLSKTLQSLTLTKIHELEKQRDSFESRKKTFLERAEAAGSQRGRLACLLDGIKDLYPAAAHDASLKNIQRWLDQSTYDATIPSSMLEDFDRQLTTKLDVQSRRLSNAQLYSRLLTEWMESDSVDSEPPTPDEGSVSDGFEVVVERQKQSLAELVDKFESVVFTPHETSEKDIFSLLDGLFPDEESQKSLERLRENIKNQGENLMKEESPFDQDSLIRCIRGLLTEDLLSDEKQAILRDFMDNKVALNEIADVLNMRFADLKEWEWNAGPGGIPVYPRQQLNGKYRIWGDEDILQLIFVQYIGIRLCNMLKGSLKTFVRHFYTFRHTPRPTREEVSRRDYFLDSQPPLYATIEKQERESYLEDFFLAQLPEEESTLYERFGCGGYDEDASDDTDADWQARVKSDRKPKSTIKQRLLRKLTVELLIQQARGRVHEGKQKEGVAITQTDLQWYATGLSHDAIFASMRYIGFSEDWINFFKKYLAAPLNLDLSLPAGRAFQGPRTRKRGVPMAHSSEKFTGELILFFLDLAVNKETGLLLYRLHDDIWLHGNPQKCAQAWTLMQKFAATFGLEFNRNKTGSVYLCPEGCVRDTSVDAVLPEGKVTIGHLKLDSVTGSWQIDQTQVDLHIRQLQKQLSEAESVLAWVRTWNSCIVRFFNNTFGEPAKCHGRKHIDSILATHERMQKEIFGEGNVVDSVKAMIKDRFDVVVPDVFLFLPEQLGGLGLRNPFINLFLVRDAIPCEPEDILVDYLKEEHEAWKAAKKMFESTDKTALKSRARKLKADKDDSWPKGFDTAEDMKDFFPLEEYAQFREVYSHRFLSDVYNQMTTLPEKMEIDLSTEVNLELAKLRDQLGGYKLDAEKLWILQMYSRELFEVCGGLSLVDKKFLPVGVFNMMRGKKVTWNMVL